MLQGCIYKGVLTVTALGSPDYDPSAKYSFRAERSSSLFGSAVWGHHRHRGV